LKKKERKKEREKQKGIKAKISEPEGGVFVLPFPESAKTATEKKVQTARVDIAKGFRRIGIVREQLPVLSLQGRKKGVNPSARGSRKLPSPAYLAKRRNGRWNGTEKMSRRRR